MSRAKQTSKRKRLKKTAPVLGAAAGLSLSLGASAGAAPEMLTPSTAARHELILAEEELSDVSLATFLSLTKKILLYSGPTYSLPEAAAAAAGVAVVGAAEAAGVDALGAAVAAVVVVAAVAVGAAVGVHAEDAALFGGDSTALAAL